jgi:hypothetical protein
LSNGPAPQRQQSKQKKIKFKKEAVDSLRKSMIMKSRVIMSIDNLKGAKLNFGNINKQQDDSKSDIDLQ